MIVKVSITLSSPNPKFSLESIKDIDPLITNNSLKYFFSPTLRTTFDPIDGPPYLFLASTDKKLFFRPFRFISFL